MNINLELYKTFYYVAKLCGITLAAEELSVSQPAVSQAIRQLEQEIGTTLFVRTSKGVRLTAAGEMLYTYVERGYETLKTGENKVLEMLNLEAGEIHIGASDMTLQFYLLPYLQEFHIKYPKIKVTVSNGPTPETLRHLQEGRIDFGIVSSPILSKAEVSIEAVRIIEDTFVAGKSFCYLKDQVLRYKELEKLPLITLEGNTSTRRYMDAFLKKQNVVLNPEFELATSDIIVQFALRDLGVANVVKDFAIPYIESGELFALNFEERVPPRHICVVKDSRNPLSTAAAKLLELMKKEY